MRLLAGSTRRKAMRMTDPSFGQVVNMFLDQAQRRLHDRKDGEVPVMVSVNIPRELLVDYLQMLRNWDVEEGTDSAIAFLRHLPREELLQVLNAIEPPFPHLMEVEPGEPGGA